MKKRDRNYLIIFLLIILIFAGYLFIKQSNVKAYKYVKQNTYPQDMLPEGIYSGTFNAYNIEFAKVEFLIHNGEINSFKIPKVIHAPWTKVRSAVMDSIQKKNTLNFDAVTGATGSSFYIKAAIHKAIKKSKQDSLSD